MRKNLIAAMLLLAFCAAAFGAEPDLAPREQDPAQHAPAGTAVFITVRDVRLLVPLAELLVGFVDKETPQGARLFLPKLAAMTAGRASYALFPPAPERPASFLFRVPIDDTKGNVDELLTQTVAQVTGVGNAKPAADGAIRELRDDGGRAYLSWAVHNGVFCVSSDKMRIARVLDPFPADRAVADDAAYKALAVHVDCAADLTAFVDLRRIVHAIDGDVQPGFGGNMAWLRRWLALDAFAAIGLSWKSNGKTVSGRIAGLTPGERRGLASLFDVPNTPPAHLDRIPEDAVIYSSTPSTTGVVGRVAKFFAELDRDVGGEFEAELAEFNKELAVDIGKDLFDNLGPVAGGLHWSDRGPEMLYLAAVREPGRLVRCANALADHNQTPLRKLDRNGRTYHILPTKPPMGWTFEGGLLVFSNTFEAAEAAIALGKAKEGGKSLASQASFQKLRLRLPGTAAMFWALDAHRAAKAAQGVIGLISLADGVPDNAKQVIGNLVDKFAEAEPGLSIGFALRNEPDAFVLHIESLAGDPLNLVAQLLRISMGTDRLQEPTEQ